MAKKKKIKTDRERHLDARAAVRGASSAWDFRRRDPKHVKTAIRIRNLG